VLITGTSTGIGRACAIDLARRGFHVFAGVRSDTDAADLRAELGGSATPLILDVTDPGHVDAAARVVGTAVGPAGLDVLINNAGIVAAGPLEYLPIPEFRRQLEVNVTGALAVTQAMLPLLRLASGRIVMISSISGRSALPVVGAYAASKYALEAVSDALRIELGPSGIRVAIIEPGRIETPIWRASIDRAERNLGGRPEVERQYGALLEAARRMMQNPGKTSPIEKVVRAVGHAVTAPRPRTRYVIGGDARLRLLIESLLPASVRDRLIRRVLDRTMGRSE